MKDTEGRWQNRLRAMGATLRGASWTALVDQAAGGGPRAAEVAGVDLKAKIGASAFAFRGFDITNLGRSPELLAHPVYRPVVAELLDEASAICSDAIGRRVDLAGRVRARAEDGLAGFPEDVATIVAMELAQVRLLERFFHVPVRQARLSFGYSIGELAAVVFAGVGRLDQLLPVPLSLAADCAELAEDTHLGILFTRAPVLPAEDVERLCVAVSSEGRGMVGPSAYLSPNTALLLGQGRTLDRVEALMGEFLPGKVMLRRNPNRWPPLHTPLVWQRNIPNRAAVAMYRIEGELSRPDPPVISCVTGSASYDGLNTRDLLIQWTDRPQRLWDAIDGTLAAGVEVVIHAGPAPNLIPATFNRLSTNVSKQMGNGYLQRLGRGVVSSMNRHAWIANLLPHRAALLRAPFIEHVILEDWLLAQPVA